MPFCSSTIFINLMLTTSFSTIYWRRASAFHHHYLHHAIRSTSTTCRGMMLRLSTAGKSRAGIRPIEEAFTSCSRRHFCPGKTHPLLRMMSPSSSPLDASTIVEESSSTSSSETATEGRIRGSRRRRGRGGPRPSREHVGVAKGMDIGRFPSYSVEKFSKAASGLPSDLSTFTVMGIETSCDDTGVAIVRSDGTILGEALASQYKIHEQWGGVVPGLARDAHASVIDSMVKEALAKAKMSSAAEVDAIGVTVGPGLEICLRVGCSTAKQLAQEYGKPFVAVHHLEAHCLMARLGAEASPTSDSQPQGPMNKEVASFPFLALLVSGGHCMILECKGVGQYRVLGGTLDDALGEAYDKAARLLKIGTGAAGGPAMEKLARGGDVHAVPLPVPMKAKKDMNFSYAGLKNAFRMAVTRSRENFGLSEEADLDEKTKADLAASFQHVAIQHLEERLERAMDLVEKEGITTLAIVGGVAANQAIRGRLQALCDRRSDVLSYIEEGLWQLVVPPPRLCTDNGVMVAWAAIEKLRLGYSDALEDQDVYARWPFAKPPLPSSSAVEEEAAAIVDASP